MRVPQTFAYSKFQRQMFLNPQTYLRRMVSYVQGQSPEPKIREYFYYIDHQGMLRMNETDRYPEFPYLSLCGRERNFVRSDDYPIVYTHVHPMPNNELHLSHNHAGDLLTKKFIPEKIFMLPETGRVYHPAPEKVGGIGLVRSKLAIEFSKNFEFENGEENPPTKFTFDGITYDLDTRWYSDIVKKQTLQSSA